jgi:hypothetical protein
MNSAPHLLSEDHRDFELVLDEALRSASDRGGLSSAGEPLTAEQLRSMALSARALISVAAADEYQHYVKLRHELRAPARTTRAAQAASAVQGSGQSAGQGTVQSAAGQGRVGLGGLARGGTEPGEPAGAGLAAVIAVLAPLLAGAAAVIFLLVGYVLEVAGPAPAFGHTLLATGWVFGAITAAAILAAAAGLLVTALRNSATSLRADDRNGLDAELDRAREAWHQALLERGIVPFLHEAQATPRADDAQTAGAPGPGRMPHLGYHGPGFSSPDGGSTAAPRPGYSSPDFSSPDFGGPEHEPE